jgi:hypothetical protein
MAAELDPSTVMALLAELIGHRRAALARGRFVFAFVEGESFIIDPSMAEAVVRGWIETPDVLVLTSAATIGAMLAGTFDAAHPSREHVFLWSGSEPLMRSLSKALAGGTSWVLVQGRDA